MYVSNTGPNSTFMFPRGTDQVGPATFDQPITQVIYSQDGFINFYICEVTASVDTIVENYVCVV